MNWHRFLPVLAQLWLQNKTEQGKGEGGRGGRQACSWLTKTVGCLRQKGERSKGSEIRKVWLCTARSILACGKYINSRLAHTKGNQRASHIVLHMDKKNEEMGLAQRFYHQRQKIMMDPVGAQEDQSPQLRERGEDSGTRLEVQEPLDLSSFTEDRSVQNTLPAQQPTVYLPPEDADLQSLNF